MRVPRFPLELGGSYLAHVISVALWGKSHRFSEKKMMIGLRKGPEKVHVCEWMSCVSKPKSSSANSSLPLPLLGSWKEGISTLCSSQF